MNAADFLALREAVASACPHVLSWSFAFLAFAMAFNLVVMGMNTWLLRRLRRHRDDALHHLERAKALAEQAGKLDAQAQSRLKWIQSITAPDTELPGWPPVLH